MRLSPMIGFLIRIMKSLFHVFSIAIAACSIGIAQLSIAGESPTKEDALRFIAAYRADEAPLNMFRVLGQREIQKGNLAKGAFLTCISRRFPTSIMRDGLIPYIQKNMPDAGSLNRISAFLESSVGQRMLNAIEANFSNTVTMTDNKIESRGEGNLGLSLEDQHAIRAFEQTSDYPIFHKFIDNLHNIFSEPSLRTTIESIKTSCGPH